MDLNDELGAKLEAEYGRDRPENAQIDYFFLILAKDCIGDRDRLKKELDQANADEYGEWKTINTTQWPQFLVGKFTCQDKVINERGREERLNSLIRKSFPGDKIIISRVCKYTTEVVEKPTVDVMQIDAMQIGQLLSDHYNFHGDYHLDHFYIVVGLNEGQETEAIETHLSIKFLTLRGGWKQVTPEANWPLTYLGFFPKAYAEETERAREWRLHIEVRKPLKEHLKDNGFNDAHVLFTRACIYSA